MNASDRCIEGCVAVERLERRNQRERRRVGKGSSD
jgi:hypothetical protein